MSSPQVHSFMVALHRKPALGPRSVCARTDSRTSMRTEFRTNMLVRQSMILATAPASLEGYPVFCGTRRRPSRLTAAARRLARGPRLAPPQAASSVPVLDAVMRTCAAFGATSAVLFISPPRFTDGRRPVSYVERASRRVVAPGHCGIGVPPVPPRKSWPRAVSAQVGPNVWKGATAQVGPTRSCGVACRVRHMACKEQRRSNRSAILERDHRGVAETAVMVCSAPPPPAVPGASRCGANPASRSQPSRRSP